MTRVIHIRGVAYMWRRWVRLSRKHCNPTLWTTPQGLLQGQLHRPRGGVSVVVCALVFRRQVILQRQLENCPLVGPCQGSRGVEGSHVTSLNLKMSRVAVFSYFMSLLEIEKKWFVFVDFNFSLRISNFPSFSDKC